jgi:hypothetical protein
MIKIFPPGSSVQIDNAVCGVVEKVIISESNVITYMCSYWANKEFKTIEMPSYRVTAYPFIKMLGIVELGEPSDNLCKEPPPDKLKPS